MNNTPETQKAVLESNGQWSFTLKECCERLERERDEARALSEERYGYWKDSIKEYEDMRSKWRQVTKERDEAQSELHDIRLNLGKDAEGYTLLHAVCVLRNERDDAMAMSKDMAGKFYRAESKAERYRQERDKAINDIVGWKNKWDCAVTMGAKAENERDDAKEESAHWKIEYEIIEAKLRGEKHSRDNGIIHPEEIIPKLERERDEARETLARITHASLRVRQLEEDYADWEKAIEDLLDLCTSQLKEGGK